MDTSVDFGLEGPSGNPRIRFLVIDDSVTMRRIISNILGRLGYPEVVQAANGREALDRLATEPIDIVVTDWYMPEMNGLDFVKALRTTPATSHIPIVIVTANAASDDIQHALELGVNGYILKPFTVETMREKIGALCAQTSPAEDAPAEEPEASAPAPEAEPAVEPAAAPALVEEAAAPAVDVTAAPVEAAAPAVDEATTAVEEEALLEVDDEPAPAIEEAAAVGA
jgi:two-component system chemotaxis response regulator CheY